MSEFYAHPYGEFGKQEKCKACAKVAARANRAARVDYYREYDVSRYASDPARRAFARKTADAWAAKYPERKRAQTTLHNAVRDGKVSKLPCAVCGDERVHGHHFDYTKPLEVVWLCPKHHMQFHHAKEPE